MSLSNLSVRARLGLLIAFVNALLLAASGYAWFAISRLNDQLESAVAMQNHVEAAADQSRRAQLEFKVQVQEWKNVLLRGQDAELFAKHFKSFGEHSSQVRTLLGSLGAAASKIGLDPAIAAKALAEHEELDRKYLQALRSYRSSDFSSAEEVDKAVRGIDRAATDHIDEIVAVVHAQGDRLSEMSAKSAATEKNQLVAGLALLALFALGVSAIVGTFTVLGITRRLQRATEAARTVAAGNLAADVEVGAQDELGYLLRSLAEMSGSLAAIVGRVRDSAEKVSTASTQIAAGNNDLSARTEEQASNLEETAASIEEMTAAVNQNAQNAVRANQEAASAAEVAQRGGKAVSEVVATMEGIQKSSRKIADIIGVIDSIAFQTNILALNAAVEAARAGEQGRGFAVVAAEVRSLAQRSAEAARQIKSLITESVERVDVGAKLAGGAGETMAEIVASVSRVSQLIGEIATATGEQSAGIAQANSAVGELDKATQQNAALVEESTAASESLRQLAHELATAVAVFQLGERASEPLQRPAAAASTRQPLSAPVAPPRIAPLRPMALASNRTVEEWKEF
jgi:methyl-accepting chemotaxis protein